MSLQRPGSRFLIPLLLAAGLLAILPRIPFLVRFEHLAYPAPERFQPDSHFLTNRAPDEFRIEVFHFTRPADHPANIGSYLVDDETREIMGPNGGDPIEWAQFLRQTRLPDDRLIVVTSSFSWPDATELALRALQEQADLTPRLVVGLEAELLNVRTPLPPELKGSVIPREIPPHFTLPEIDHLTAPPSITPPLFGISQVRGLKIEEDGNLLRIPMLVRWGDHLLPSLQLAALLITHELKPSGLLIDPRGYLQLGETGPIIRIDPSGFTPLLSEAPDYRSASSLQIYPSRAETIKIIAPENPPLPARGLASQLAQALTQKPHAIRTYQRWPLAVEILLLALISLVAQTRRPWLALPVALIIAALSLALSHWILITPVLVLLTSRFFIRSPKIQPDTQGLTTRFY